MLVCVYVLVGDCTSEKNDVVQLRHPSLDSTEWTSQEIPFFLKKGENPDDIRLNLLIKGKGTVRMDDIRFLKGSCT